jgi:type II secretory pathway predicted ATPase ExeA
VSLPFITDSHGNALDQLGRVFSEGRPLAIMIGEGKAGASLLISRFLGGLGDDVSVARITEPCADGIGGMQAIIRGIGFDAKKMPLADLENVFTMFLSSQKINRRRTIICIEEAQDNGRWLFEQVLREKYGLTVILSGRPGLNGLLNTPPLNALVDRAERVISLAPFTLEETREFVRWMIESAGVADVSQLFEFDAVTLIHELCEGIPDSISTLSIKSREVAKKQKKTKVTTAEVTEAANLLQMTPNVRLSDADTVMMHVVKVGPEKEVRGGGQLIVRTGGNLVQEQPLNRDRILIGRDAVCDIRIPSNLVSRHHALIHVSLDGVQLVDLSSTNGTFVDGREIQQCDLEDRQVIGIGDSQIEYIAGSERKDGLSNLDETGVFERDDFGSQSATDFSGELRIIDFDPEKTTVDPKRRVRK